MDAGSPDSGRRSRTVAEARLHRARAMLPQARRLRDDVKRQADAIGAVERRFGTDEVQHLARLLDDLWMSADNLICDIEPDEDLDDDLEIGEPHP